jgi:hypothetical protein
VNPDELARAWVADAGLDPTPAALALAGRRIIVWGRLAQTPLAHVPGVVRVRVLEHGLDLVPRGCVMAEAWVLGDAAAVQSRAREIHAVCERLWGEGLLVVVAVHPASRWQRMRAWLGW